jgi:hypothetical protein
MVSYLKLRIFYRKRGRLSRDCLHFVDNCEEYFWRIVDIEQKIASEMMESDKAKKAGLCDACFFVVD